jgi:uncharacterized protein (TIGR02466 family)
MYNKVLGLYKEGKYKEVDAIISLEENDKRLLEIKGLSALKINEFQSAYQTFQKLVNQEESTSYSYHLGLASLNLKKYLEASQQFKDSMNDARLSTSSKINLSYCLIQLGEYTAAEHQLVSLVQTNNNIQQSWYLLLKLYRETSDLSKYNDTLLLSKKRIGGTDEWFYSHLYLLYLQKDYQTIIQVTQNQKQNIETRTKKIIAKSFVNISMFQSAINIYKEILKDNINAENYYNLASVYSKLTSKEDLNESLINANKCLELDRIYHYANYCKSLVYKKLGLIYQAETEIDLALAIENNNEEYLYLKAELLYIKTNNDESMKFVNKILSINSSNQLALRLKGILNIQLNRFKKSEKDLKKAIKIKETDQRAISYYILNQIIQNKPKCFNNFMKVGKFVRQFDIDPTHEYRCLKDFNTSLSIDIKNHSLLRREPNGLAARKGYLTDDLFADSTQSINLFKKLMLEKINQYIKQLPDDKSHYMLKHKTFNYDLNAWATWVNGDGYIDKHIHEESWISGAYYCKVPKITKNSDSKLGFFEYGCIPNDINYINSERKFIEPKEGKLIIFPSYLYHQTIPHESQEDRISIAFDLTPKSWKV